MATFPANPAALVTDVKRHALDDDPTIEGLRALNNQMRHTVLYRQLRALVDAQQKGR